MWWVPYFCMSEDKLTVRRHPERMWRLCTCGEESGKKIKAISCERSAVSYKLLAISCELKAVSCELQAVSCELLAISCELKAEAYDFH